MHLHNPPVPPSQRTETAVPPELDGIILKCLAKDPSERYASADELAEDLESCCATLPSWDNRDARSWWKIHMPQMNESATVAAG